MLAVRGGNDHLEYQGTAAATLSGGAGGDNLLSGEGNDSLDGGAGNDHIESDGGNDSVVAGEGNDEIEGGRGNDTLYGDKADGTGTSNDFIDGGVGTNLVYAGPGDDIVVGTVRGAVAIRRNKHIQDERWRARSASCAAIRLFNSFSRSSNFPFRSTSDSVFFFTDFASAFTMLASLRTSAMDLALGFPFAI